MGNRATGILAILVLVAVVAVYVTWENTKNDGQTTLRDANPNAPAITEPSVPGGAGSAPAPAPQK